VKAEACRFELVNGLDPLDARKARRRAARLEATRAKTFKDCAEAYIAARKAEWSNEKHKYQYRQTLIDGYAGPVLGALPVGSIDTELVLKVLEPVWLAKPETAGRLRGRIEAVLDWATARGYRTGDNPARLKGHLEHLLPKQSKIWKVTHHPALGFDEVPEFLTKLKDRRGSAARALEFLILTATRTGEVIGATWCEFDLSAKVWTIPANRTKMRVAHRVPLSMAALALLVKPDKAGPDNFVFGGGKGGTGLSNMAMLRLLRRMGRADLTSHGFRSSFRDWVAERTNVSHEVAEMALGHSISNRVEAAYRRGDLLEKRGKLMEAWASFCTTIRKTEAVRAAGSVNKWPQPNDFELVLD
jgi:integrase